MGIECPRCGQIDDVKKASAIAAAGTSRSSYRGRSEVRGGSGRYVDTTISGGGQTDLAARLSPPAEPHAFWALAMIGGFLCVGFSIMLMIRFAFHRYLLYLLGAGVALIGIGFWDLVTRYTKAMEEREEDMAHWRQSYYCFRCDIVFIPESEEIEISRSKGKQANWWPHLKRFLRG